MAPMVQQLSTFVGLHIIRYCNHVSDATCARSGSVRHCICTMGPSGSDMNNIYIPLADKKGSRSDKTLSLPPRTDMPCTEPEHSTSYIRPRLAVAT